VKIPSLSNSIDTILYMYYGNPSAPNQQNPTGVWDTNYVAVQHLQARQGSNYDSTIYNNNGVPQGALNQNITGKIDGADEFDGTTSYIDCGKNPSLNITNQITVSAWVKADTSRAGRIASKHGPSSGSFGWMLAQSWGRLEWRISTTGSNWNGGTTTASSFPVGTWCYFTATYDGSSMRVYINGVEDTGGNFPRALTGAIKVASESTQIGRDGLGKTTYIFDGSIDEVQISNSARDLGWISTCFNNQNNPSSFYSIGSEESG
jgi:MSHA biogenesis protein MshQ